METLLDELTEELVRMRRCLDSIARVLSLPAGGTGGVALIGRTLLDAVVSMLGLDLAYLRLAHPTGGRPVELHRSSGLMDLHDDSIVVGRMVDRWLGPEPPSWPATCRIPLQRVELSVVTEHFGPQASLGLLVVASVRRNFPGQTERLLLTIVAGQASLGLQKVRLLEDTRDRPEESLWSGPELHAVDGGHFASPEADLPELRCLYAALSPREKEVLALVVSGLSNKRIGRRLGISEITVKAHRGKVMRKMRANSLAELVTRAARLRLGTGAEGLRRWEDGRSLLDQGPRGWAREPRRTHAP